MRKRYIEKQHDINDCGAACLSSISKYYGIKVSLTQCRELSRTDTNGTSFFGLIQAANKLGYHADGLSGSPEDLINGIKDKSFACPFIARVLVDGILEHFVVVYEINSKYIVVADPADGTVKKKKYDEFFNIWQGQILTLIPDKNAVNKENTVTPNEYVKILFKNKAIITKTVLISALLSVFALSSSFVIERIVDMIQKNTLKNTTILAITGVLAVIAILQIVFGIIRGKFLTKISASIENDIVKKSIRHMLKLPIKFFENHKNGDILSRILDIDKIVAAMLDCSISLLLNSGIIIICEVTIFIKSPVLFAISMALILAYSLIVFLYNKPISNTSRNFLKDKSAYNTSVKDTIDKMFMIKTYSCESYFEDNINENVEKSIESNKKHTMVNFWQSTLTSGISSLGIVALLGIGCYMVSKGVLTLGELILTYTMTGYVVSPISQILNTQPTIIKAIEASKRLNDIIEGTPEEEIEKIADISLKNKDINISGLNFRYGFRNYILNDINLNIKSGSRVAFVGQSGCGKTTLAKLLLRLYDVEENSGNIKYGDFNINSVPIKDLRQKVMYLSQRSSFKSSSVRDNITLGLDISDEEILKTFQKCGCLDLLTALPMGLDTMLVEEGANLSEGQKQKLAIIRTLLRKPDVLIIDEATSNLDALSEKVILDAIFNYCAEENATCIMITHKLSLIEDCDDIYIFDKGTIVDEGPHEKLLTSCNMYSVLWQEQCA